MSQFTLTKTFIVNLLEVVEYKRKLNKHSEKTNIYFPASIVQIHLTVSSPLNNSNISSHISATSIFE